MICHRSPTLEVPGEQQQQNVPAPGEQTGEILLERLLCGSRASERYVGRPGLGARERRASIPVPDKVTRDHFHSGYDTDLHHIGAMADSRLIFFPSP